MASCAAATAPTSGAGRCTARCTACPLARRSRPRRARFCMLVKGSGHMSLRPSPTATPGEGQAARLLACLVRVRARQRRCLRSARSPRPCLGRPATGTPAAPARVDRPATGCGCARADQPQAGALAAQAHPQAAAPAAAPAPAALAAAQLPPEVDSGWAQVLNVLNGSKARTPPVALFPPLAHGPQPGRHVWWPRAPCPGCVRRMMVQCMPRCARCRERAAAAAPRLQVRTQVRQAGSAGPGGGLRVAGVCPCRRRPSHAAGETAALASDSRARRSSRACCNERAHHNTACSCASPAASVALGRRSPSRLYD